MHLKSVAGRAFLVVVLGIAGCADPAATKLKEAEDALTAQHYDDALAALTAVRSTWPESEAAKRAAVVLPQAQMSKGVALEAAGDFEAAMKVYEVVGRDWASSPEAAQSRARFQASALAEVKKRLASGDLLGAAVLALGAPLDTADLDALSASNADLASAVEWQLTEGKPMVERMGLALRLAKDGPHLTAVVLPWLADHVGEVYGPKCGAMPSTLGALDLPVLDALEADCKVIATYAAPSAIKSQAEQALANDIPGRRAEIRASPEFRTLDALNTCQEYRRWVLATRARIKALAFDQYGREGGEARVQAAAYKFADEVEGWKNGRLGSALAYLRDRMESESDEHARFLLAVSVKRECDVR